jgi:hypothetical protein
VNQTGSTRHCFVYRTLANKMEILNVPRIVVTLVILRSILKHIVVLDNIEGHPSTQITSELFPCNNTLAMKHCLTTTNRRSCHNRSSYLYIFALVLLNANDCHPDPVLRSILARYAAKHVHGQKLYSRLHVTIASYGITNTA